MASHNNFLWSKQSALCRRSARLCSTRLRLESSYVCSSADGALTPAVHLSSNQIYTQDSIRSRENSPSLETPAPLDSVPHYPATRQQEAKIAAHQVIRHSNFHCYPQADSQSRMQWVIKWSMRAASAQRVKVHLPPDAAAAVNRSQREVCGI